ncbi:F-box protein At2g27310 [Ricinus communis]|uniref:F-box protein At2g27310 n=1 Tax=Ricinus communis TaxID=3988 RepID=UPI00201B2865|nr:F-box protein At2g27310 [Ricinus communis]
MALATPPSSLTIHQHEVGTISAVYHDIFRTHILTRLDGPALASLSCTSSELYTLCTEDKLWQNICKSIWPSINTPLIRSVISTFPSGHRSFFSNSYPLLHHHRHSFTNLAPATEELISAVDVYYKSVAVFSEVETTETVTGCFSCSPFRVDILHSEEFVPTWVQHVGEKDSWLKQLEENVTLSWILIDPKQKRAMNLSSKRAVSVQRHWLTGEVLVKFATILAGIKGSEKEYVECEMVVTCGGKEGEEVRVRDVSMRMDDMEGRSLTGKDSLVILNGAMERGERRKGEDGKERYKDFLGRKREMIKRKQNQRRGSVLDWICNATGVTYFMA